MNVNRALGYFFGYLAFVILYYPWRTEMGDSKKLVILEIITCPIWFIFSLLLCDWIGLIKFSELEW